MRDVLMPAPMMPMIAEQLAGVATLHKLWEAPDRDAALAALAPKIVAMAVGGGHQPIDAAFMGRFPNLKIVSSFGVGYDHVDAAWAGAHGILVTNTPDVLNEEVADTALGLLLCTVRRFPQAERFVRAGKWLEGNFPLTDSLRGKTIGILGLGRIGKAIARRCEAFGLKVVYHGRSPQDDVGYLYFPTLLGMARAVDILLVITPGGPATAGLVNAEVLDALGPRGTLINVARGSVVDEPALVEALRQGRIAAAGLDVFADEPRVPQALIEMDNVVLLPHVGSGSHHTRRAMAQLVIDNIAAFLDGRPPLTPVPETPWPVAGAKAK
ncbi:MAG: 2-hydroxyacid dehydrogenase [Methylobacteriaceae bacterium]|nr:2-hydroxyacid dehydrogenase [Methylobacteriaceae bacterium]